MSGYWCLIKFLALPSSIRSWETRTEQPTYCLILRQNVAMWGRLVLNLQSFCFSLCPALQPCFVFVVTSPPSLSPWVTKHLMWIQKTFITLNVLRVFKAVYRNQTQIWNAWVYYTRSLLETQGLGAGMAQWLSPCCMSMRTPKAGYDNATLGEQRQGDPRGSVASRPSSWWVQAPGRIWRTK